MIRILMAMAALSALPAAALGQAPAANPAGVTVQAQPQEAYIIRLDVTGKNESEIRRMIRDASGTVCRYAPRPGNVLEFNTVYTTACVKQAEQGAFEQLAAVLDRRQGAPLTRIALAFPMR